MPNRVPLIKRKSTLHLSALGLIALYTVLAALSVGLESVHAQGTAPTISTVAITSNPGSDNTYATGDIITVSLTFSEAVTVDTTGGTPLVRLEHGREQAARRTTPATGAAQLCSRSATPWRPLTQGLQRGSRCWPTA